MVIDKSLLEKVSSEATKSARLRMNYNFHSSAESPSQRMLNALEPETFIPIHRHRLTDETYILLKGKLTVRLYNEFKKVLEECPLDPEKGKYGINIPAGSWHDLIVHQTGTVIFECKDGPYTPLTDEDILT